MLQISIGGNNRLCLSPGEKKLGIARLFAAASQSEAIHSRNHLAAIKQLGINEPRAGNFTGATRTTIRNLQDAWQGEA